MKVLIIGSKGFIGKALIEHLRQGSVEVFECDIPLDYANEYYFQIDPSDPNFDRVFSYQNYSHCVNCSGAASVGDSLNNPLRDFVLNTFNVYKMLNAIRVHQPECRFINMSSAAVYGNPEYLPVSESSYLKPMSPYGFHKKQSEEICLEFFQQFSIQTLSLRVFSAYGEGLKKQIFWDIYQKAKRGKNVELFGTGNETRDFINIADLVNAIYLTMRNGNFDGGAINIANGEESSIRNIAELLVKYYGNGRFVSFNGVVNKGNPTNWKADISKLASLGYKPEVDMKLGLERYYNWALTIG